MPPDSLHPLRTDGSTVDASFDVSALPVFEIVYHHKAGARGSPRSVNADYHEGLELLLRRLAALEATILGISVDSGVARTLDPAERELNLQFPIPLDSTTDAAILRLTITRAQKLVARRPDAKPGGGNDQKTIRMTISLQTPGISTDDLATLLVGGDTHSGEQEWRAGSARSLRDVGAELPQQQEVEVPLNGLADTDSGADSAIRQSMTRGAANAPSRLGSSIRWSPNRPPGMGQRGAGNPRGGRHRRRGCARDLASP